jgi:hypothetical protein
MRAEPWLDETGHGINHAISFECDYRATTRRERDFPCWHFSDMASLADDVRF